MSSGASKGGEGGQSKQNTREKARHPKMTSLDLVDLVVFGFSQGLS